EGRRRASSSTEAIQHRLNLRFLRCRRICREKIRVVLSGANSPGCVGFSPSRRGDGSALRHAARLRQGPWGRYAGCMNDVIANLTTKAVDWSVRIVGVLIALLVALMIARSLQRAAERVMERRNVDPTLRGFAGTLVRYTVLITVVVGCLGVFGIETTSIAAVLGSAGLALGLAFQGTLSNFAAGVMLLVFRPFKVDDVISVAGVTGKVSKIELFTCDLVTGDNRKLIIPNKNVFGSTIEN